MYTLAGHLANVYISWLCTLAVTYTWCRKANWDSQKARFSGQVSHRFASFLTVSHCISLFLDVSHCLRPFLTVSHRFPPFFIVSHRCSPSPSLPSSLSYSSPPSKFCEFLGFQNFLRFHYWVQHAKCTRSSWKWYDPRISNMILVG